VQIITDVDSCPWLGQRSVITIGAYDGVHLGHRSVISEVRRRASLNGWRSAVVTFDRHPARVVRPDTAPRLLTDAQQRLELLEATGVDATVVLSFDDQQRREQPSDFVRRVLVEGLRAAVVVVGEDFHFGVGRTGNVALLRELGAQFDFEVEPMRLLDRHDVTTEPVSSTAIRRALAGGAVDQAAAMLGRPFEARGPVIQGDQRGRLLGFPTANVAIPAEICLPADGVYAGWYERPDGSRYACAVNVGRRPTFYDHATASLLEAHLMDFDGSLYGEEAKIGFVSFLRSERKFDGIDALVAQLKLDCEAARAALAS
jgi:riboflavin kinase / FMN adenylyltransferase